MSLSFTAEQQFAIERRDGPLLLSAKAGSGKTSVLVERYVAMVMQDEIAPSSILAVTFTDRAAGEMRSRIRKLLIERGGRGFVAESESAWISTLHGFCMRVLRQHCVAVGIDPAFRVLDEGESRELRESAFDAALRMFMAGGDEHVELAAAFTMELLATEITGIYDLLRTRGQRIPRLPEVRDPEPADPEPLRRTVELATSDLQGAGDGKTVQAARAGLSRLGALIEAGASDPAGWAKALPGAGNTGALKNGPYADALQALRDYCQAFHDAAGIAAVRRLDGLLGSFATHYERAKRDAGAVDYADLELLTRDLLVASPGLRDSYRERFARVMVDEFQDINPLQLELLELLDSGNTFVVGDEYQAIYGFRHADVDVFRARRARLSESGAALVLHDNFRSHPHLLDALNAVFSGRFGESYEPLSHGQQERHRDEPRLEVLLTERDWNGETDDDERDLRWRGPEARLIAGRVAELVESKQFRPREIAVLLRAASDMHVYERALELRGIPTLASGGKGFWARRQIRDLLAFLASLANPRDEVELFALLAGPLAGISSTGLVQIADAAPAGRRWDALARDPDELSGVLSPADSAALDRFRGWFAPLRLRTPQMSLAALLDHAISDLGYDLHVLGLPAGRRRLANLFKLQRLATQFETVKGRDIRGFVDRARAELEAQAREPEAPIEIGEADAVQLMTMHAAKGLEFPVVVCADLGRQPMSRRGRLLVDGERIGLRLPSLRGGPANTLEFEDLAEEHRRRDQAEEDRVLYVALTRARELLIVSGGEKLADWKPPAPGCPPIRWLAPALVPDLAALLEAEPVAEAVSGGGAALRLAVLTPERAGEMLAIPGADPQGSFKIHSGAPPPDPEPVPPPSLPSRGVPSRLSYTALSAYGRCAYNYYLRRVLRLPEADPGELAEPAGPAGIDPRLRGTLVHELLEELDLTDPRLPGADRVAELASAYELDLDEAAIFDCLALVSAFIDGPLAPRLRRAARIKREHPFSFPLGDSDSQPLVGGVVDVVAFEPGGGALVVDYKTDQVSAGEDLESLVEVDYGIQRRIYGLAALRGGAPTVDVAHLFLQRPEEPVVVTYTQRDVSALEADVLLAASGLLAGDFEPTLHPHRGLCATCPGRESMCSYDEEMTARFLPA